MRKVEVKGYATFAGAERKLRSVIPINHALERDTFILAKPDGRFVPALVVRSETMSEAFVYAHHGLYVFN